MSQTQTTPTSSATATSDGEIVSQVESAIAADIGQKEAKLALTICDLLATTTKPLLDICMDAYGYDPENHTDPQIKETIAKQAEAARVKFNRWKLRSPTLASIYTQARLGRADAIVDEIIDIADTEPDANKAKVRVDARKWAAGKFNRQLYGDDPQAVVNNTTVNNSVDAGALMDEISRRLARKAALQNKSKDTLYIESEKKDAAE